MLLVAESNGSARLTVVQLASWLPANTSPAKRRNIKLQYRRVCKALVKRGLLTEAGVAVSVSGRATGELSDWVGKRVPKGYQRETLAFALSPSGRQATNDFLPTFKLQQRNFIAKVAKDAILSASEKLFD